jgi:hypothetical protein
MPFIVTLVSKSKRTSYRWENYLPKCCWTEKEAYRLKRQAEKEGVKVRIIERAARPYA